MTHQFNPLYGKEYKMIERKKIWGEDRIQYINENNEMCLIPTSWTDVAEPDLFITVSEGRSSFRFDDLQELSKILKTEK